jgi:K+ transporter
VVFGDIGTSPLYTLKTVLDYTGPHPDPADTLG